ncbi:hypothetical protein CKA55_00240 [Arcobacter suis]|uniref:Uncharacterized protein n=1 Tax=Arcobacter suis CECT 7833 TaxID=663365 RepID=A0AAD0SPL8_9BACT|nr:hypothetical protein [Arcobacter suis]AXX89200.1 hypothetical protein ASUIS_0704 [Arcobacter suis CECT 7833]RWS47800.1 hypothetical protein CKA55_00240 [Arcobacter suis]
MKDLTYTIIKLIIITAIIVIAFIFFQEKPALDGINFNINKRDAPSIPSKLQWSEPFKGIENVPPKPKENK